MPQLITHFHDIFIIIILTEYELVAEMISVNKLAIRRNFVSSCQILLKLFIITNNMTCKKNGKCTEIIVEREKGRR